jgi:hypothetical protein
MLQRGTYVSGCLHLYRLLRVADVEIGANRS